MPQYNQCSKRYRQNPENQMFRWHFLQGQSGHNGKRCPLAGCHPKQPQAQKLILTAKPSSVSFWRSHNVLQGTKAAETRGTGQRDISMKEVENSNETGYAEVCFYLGSSVPESKPCQAPLPSLLGVWHSCVLTLVSLPWALLYCIAWAFAPAPLPLILD